MNLDELPRDIILYIAMSIDLSDIYSLSQTSKKLNTIINNDMFWMNRLIQDYNIYDHKNNKKYYQYIYQQMKNPKVAMKNGTITGNIDLVRLSIEKGVDVNKININGHYPIITSIENNHINLVKYLIEKGADVNIERFEPLKYASSGGNLYIVKYLIETGVDINSYEATVALGWAASAGHLNIVKYFVKIGVNIHVYNDYPLRMAITNGHEDIVKFLENLS